MSHELTSNELAEVPGPMAVVTIRERQGLTLGEQDQTSLGLCRWELSSPLRRLPIDRVEGVNPIRMHDTSRGGPSNYGLRRYLFQEFSIARNSSHVKHLFQFSSSHGLSLNPEPRK